MNQPEALIFDVDGTLADTERHGHLVAFNLAFADAGLDWIWDDELYHKLLRITGGKERIAHYIDDYRAPFTPGPEGREETIAALHRAKTEHFMALVKRGGLPLRPGVARLINEARAVGVRLAIATTTSPENVTTLLTSTLGSDAVDWFDVIAAGDMVEAKKPAPDIYHCALEELKLPPSSCIAFEDSANGIRSAKGAGLTTVITPCDYTRDDDFSGADLIVDQLGEPESPCRLFAGSLYGRQMVDLALLGALLGSR